MPTSPITGKTDLSTYKLLVGGKALGRQYEVLDIETEQAVNRIATACVTIALDFGSGENQTFKYSEEDRFAPGKDIEIQLGYHATDKNVFKGIIVNIGIRAYNNRSLYILECSNKAVKLTLGRKSKFFKEKTDSAIITAIINDSGLSPDVSKTDYEHKQLIQYHASDWDFIRARAEANGLLVYTTEDKVHVKKPKVDGQAILEVRYGKDVIRFDGKVESRYQMASIKAYSWDYTAQKVAQSQSSEPSVNGQGSLAGKKLVKVLGVNEYEYHTSTPLLLNDLKAWSNAHLLHARLAHIYGEMDIVGTDLAKVNTFIDIHGFGNRMNGSALITKVKHRLEEGVWTTTIGFGLSAELLANNPAIHEPVANGLLPAVQGLQIGKVKKIEADPANEIRILVDVPVIEKDGVGIWARLTNFYSTNSKGAFFIPEIDDEVVVGFLNDDPRFAIILGSMYSSKIKPPYTPDKDNSIKAIVTKNDLKLEFNDKDKIITIETPAGNKTILSDKEKSITLEDQSGNKIEMTKSGITIDSPKEIKISAGSKLTMTAKSGISAKTSMGDVEVEGKNVNLSASLNFKASANTNATVSGNVKATLDGSAFAIISGGLVKIN